MAYNEKLAQRVRMILAKRKGIAEKKMFGGIAFMLNKKMCCGIDKNELIVRIDPERHEEFLSKPHTREFDLSGRKSIRGWLLVTEKGCSSEKESKTWVEECVKFVSLPAKKHKVKK